MEGLEETGSHGGTLGAWWDSRDMGGSGDMVGPWGHKGPWGHGETLNMGALGRRWVTGNSGDSGDPGDVVRSWGRDETFQAWETLDP